MDDTKLGMQTVTFSYTWKKGSVYEKMLTLAKDIEIVAKPQYICSSGGGFQLIEGQNTVLSFTINRSYKDEESFDRFVKALADGSLLDPAEYTVKPGSLEVSIAASYIKTLKAGDHTFEVVFQDGSAKVTASIVARPAPTVASTVYRIPVTGVE